MMHKCLQIGCGQYYSMLTLFYLYLYMLIFEGSPHGTLGSTGSSPASWSSPGQGYNSPNSFHAHPVPQVPGGSPSLPHPSGQSSFAYSPIARPTPDQTSSAGSSTVHHRAQTSTNVMLNTSADPLDELQAVTQKIQATKRSESPTDQFIRDLVEPNSGSKESLNSSYDAKDLNASFENNSAMKLQFPSPNTYMNSNASYNSSNLNHAYSMNHTYRQGVQQPMGVVHHKPNANPSMRPSVQPGQYPGPSGVQVPGVVHHRPPNPYPSQFIQNRNPTNVAIPGQFSHSTKLNAKPTKSVPLFHNYPQTSRYPRPMLAQRLPFPPASQKPSLRAPPPLLTQRPTQRLNVQNKTPTATRMENKRPAQDKPKDTVIRVKFKEDHAIEAQRKEAWMRAEQFLAGLKNKKAQSQQAKPSMGSWHYPDNSQQSARVGNLQVHQNN